MIKHCDSEFTTVVIS